MVEVFRTSVEQQEEAAHMVATLLLHFPDCRINFDLDDCDRILRVEGNDFAAESISAVMKENGFMCTALE